MTVTVAKGFLAAGVRAGLKSSGNKDLALVLNQGPLKAAAVVFTTNRCQANPIIWSKQVIADGEVSAIVLNSGGANCYTGAQGFQTTHSTAEKVAEVLGVSAGDVLVCSTGLIGEQLDLGKLTAGVTAAAAELSADAGPSAAEAIMTTDSVSKTSHHTSPNGWSVGGMAKGAGMLAPGLATMLVVVTTDAVVDSPTLDKTLRAATHVTFDRLDSDGCMSTNDQVTLMASGASGITPDQDEFQAAVTAVCHDLAQQLLRDAEGSSHDIAIEVVNAASEDDAVEVGRSVARNNLFKAAIYGNDPNLSLIHI
jgi:glutamate N-acetyltransferase/amino-acid N-acetyltransferase